jgi:hypothetical protein
MSTMCKPLKFILVSLSKALSVSIDSLFYNLWICFSPIIYVDEINLFQYISGCRGLCFIRYKLLRKNMNLLLLSICSQRLTAVTNLVNRVRCSINQFSTIFALLGVRISRRKPHRIPLLCIIKLLLHRLLFVNIQFELVTFSSPPYRR